jgi:hypothetical protein
MKNNKGKEASFTQPLLKDLINRQKADSKITFDGVFNKADVGSTPLEQPDLYQDPGNGYNANFVFPQD